MAGFIILTDGRAYSDGNGLCDCTIERIAADLPRDLKGREFRNWLLDQRSAVRGPGMTGIDVRELTPEYRTMFLTATKKAFYRAKARGPQKSVPRRIWERWMERFADLVKMIDLAEQGRPPLEFNPHVKGVIPRTEFRSGPGWQ